MEKVHPAASKLDNNTSGRKPAIDTLGSRELHRLSTGLLEILFGSISLQASVVCFQLLPVLLIPGATDHKLSTALILTACGDKK